MTQEQIQHLFKLRYNQNDWKQFLGHTFINAQLLIKAEILTDINNDVARQALKLGHIVLNESGIERHIAVYEVILAKGIVLERNRVGLRNLLRRYWKDIDAAFIVYHHPDQTKWRFTYVSELTGYNAEGDHIKIITEPKRYTYILGEGESCRTAAERFAIITNKGGHTTLDDIKEAFSVEKLSKAFFDEYKSHYEDFVEFLTGKRIIKIEDKWTEIVVKQASPQMAYVFAGEDKEARDFCKKLLGRIVFIYFIQKKGWLHVPIHGVWGEGDFDFISRLFDNCSNKELFYSEYLTKLFFDTLNTPRKGDIIELVTGKPSRIPFLNGGLFEEVNKKYRDLIFPTHLFQNLFNFFNQYNFTIYEDDPNDHTVAVDPEMLGHIFENLLEDNKDKGAFYTPKEIVHYMCQESLTEYLDTQLKIDRHALEKLIKYKEISEEIKPYLKEIDQLLSSVKICDPAIGSGAFPMGLLHEIYTIKQTLYTFEHGNIKGFNASAIKLNIIQNSIYGVDIEKGAVDIARLRFWLSLIVDEPEPKALPNLDYKIVAGNSLVSKLGDNIVDVDWSLNDTSHGLFGQELVKQKTDLLRKISKKQKEYFNPEVDKKKQSAEIRNLKIDLLVTQLELMIKKTQQEVEPLVTSYKDKKNFVKATEQYHETIGWKNQISKLKQLKAKPEALLHYFDWRLDFPEVMNEQVAEKTGFDIIIANPPWDVYQGEKKKEIEGLLGFEIYHKCQGGKINAYELFLAKTHTLLSKLGINCQIFQNSFLADNSSKGVREFYLNEHKIISIDSFPERDDPKKRVFESVKMSVCILISQKINLTNYTFKLNIHKDSTRINFHSVHFEKKEIFDFDPINCVIPNLEENEKHLFRKYYKSKTNKNYSDYFNCLEGELNMTFHRDYMINDNSKPLIIKGAQVQRYFLTSNPSQGIVQYVDDVNYLNDYSRSKKASHHSLKRIALQGISGANDKVRIISTLIDGDMFCANSCNYIIENETNNNFPVISLLAIFNSKLTNWVYRKTSTNSNVNCYEVNGLKLPLISDVQIKLLEELVTEVLLLKSQYKDTTKIETQIDILVYKLYDLDYKDILVIDPDFGLTEHEYDAVVM